MRLEPPEPRLEDEPGTRRAEPRPDAPDRRRPPWREFRHAYPGILATIFVALAIMVAADAWLVAKRLRYEGEIERLRASMSDVERQRTDMILATDENRFRTMIELIRRQARGDQDLNLAVSVDSGVMYLQREGAVLREMHALIGPEKTVGEGPDTVRLAPPRGARTVERVLGPSDAWEVPRWVYLDRGLDVPAERSHRAALGPRAIMLSGGTVIYSMPSVGPLNDSTYVMPGGVRVAEEDLSAIAPNLQPGQTVYFY
ncbi:MAG TPA: hypothetical protein VMM18_17880 [Gemmatimonadaceae bacterium]|nr:hypothetical protein [Gemmatimonadaceae bacterium]